MTKVPVGRPPLAGERMTSVKPSSAAMRSASSSLWASSVRSFTRAAARASPLEQPLDRQDPQQVDVEHAQGSGAGSRGMTHFPAGSLLDPFDALPVGRQPHLVGDARDAAVEGVR